jgi:hypothetical protein
MCKKLGMNEWVILACVIIIWYFILRLVKEKLYVFAGITLSGGAGYLAFMKFYPHFLKNAERIILVLFPDLFRNGILFIIATLLFLMCFLLFIITVLIESIISLFISILSSKSYSSTLPARALGIFLIALIIKGAIFLLRIVSVFYPPLAELSFFQLLIKKPAGMSNLFYEDYLFICSLIFTGIGYILTKKRKGR